LKSPAQRNCELTQDVKDDEIRCKKAGHTVDQSNAIQARRQLSINRNHQEAGQRSGRAGVAFDFRTGASEDERVADWLDDVVGRHQDEQVDHQ
jgi:transcription initiation factor TFIIIB Brf1 subunit/transcription initiation factor TFIIB